MIVNAKNGVSSCELARALGITQKSAWHMGHRIRLSMRSGIYSFCGEVEADETFIGGKARFIHASRRREVAGSGHLGKIPVGGLLERGKEGGKSRVKLRVLAGTRQYQVIPHVLNNVSPGSAVYTDALPSYKTLSFGFQHEVIDHAISYVNGRVHTNGLENFWSLLKRTLKGTYINVDAAHLFRYLDEQATRFNERGDNDAGRFVRSMKRVSGNRVTYRRLTGKSG
jgi:transposase-like protein